MKERVISKIDKSDYGITAGNEYKVLRRGLHWITVRDDQDQSHDLYYNEFNEVVDKKKQKISKKALMEKIAQLMGDVADLKEQVGGLLNERV